jgi:hypothetical protein
LQHKKPTTPIKGGRSTVPTHSDGISGMISGLDFIVQPEFDIRLLEVLEYLAAYNHDVGYAVDNIVSLANTDYTLEFVDGISDETMTAAMTHINDKIDTWYNFADGINSMNNDFLTQLAITGAISGEFVVCPDLSGIDQIVRVNPKNIKFIFDKETESFHPVQQSGLIGLRTVDAQGYIPLNSTTYKYIAMRRFKESPYALPLFLSALESIGIQKDMLTNLAFVMKKLGMLGFMEVLMDIPERSQNESEAAFKIKINEHLAAASKEAGKGVSNGLVVGFKGQHEFKHNETKGNAQGANEIYNLNEQNLMAGLKQAPEMLGRQFNTSETFGRVLLAKFSSQIDNFQRAYASFLKAAFNLELILSGIAITNIIKSVEFEKPMLGDAVRAEEAQAKKIANLDTLYNQGVISQEVRAQRLGEEAPDLDEPRKSSAPLVDEDDPDGGSSATKDGDATDGKTTEEQILIAFDKANDEQRAMMIEVFADILGSGIEDIHVN